MSAVTQSKWLGRSRGGRVYLIMSLLANGLSIMLRGRRGPSFRLLSMVHTTFPRGVASLEIPSSLIVDLPEAGLYNHLRCLVSY
jgi:hypothetical protein